jgi:two-component system, OmpR family, response regulator
MPHLLLADDDLELALMLKEYLEGSGFQVQVVSDGALALKRALEENFDLVILDIMMPGLNGLDVLRDLRAQKVTPVLMLTARGEDVDSIVGLELGADDYLPKPCNPRVLEARIRAVLRRSVLRAELGGNGPAQPIRIGDLSLHGGTRSVMLGNLPIVLTSTEFSILEILMREAGRVVSKEELSEFALARPLSNFDRSLDMHVSNLRRKLGPLTDGGERIKTVRGIGYQYLQQ